MFLSYRNGIACATLPHPSWKTGGNLLTRDLKLRYIYCSAAAGVKLQRLAWLDWLCLSLVVERKWGCSRKSGTERPERHAEFPRVLRRPGDHCRAFPFLPLFPPNYRIDWTARESTWANPMITDSSNTQAIGVILDFIRHLLIGFVCGQTDVHTVYIKEGQKASCIPVPDVKPLSAPAK